MGWPYLRSCFKTPFRPGKTPGLIPVLKQLLTRLTIFAIAAGTLIAIMLFAALSGVVAAIFPARRAAKLDMLSSISSE